MSKVRFIALYLPQFHPVKENDEVWGKGFTEWTNVAKGKPLFKGHYQPHIPADLGFYDLRLEETRIAQAELAKKYGIEGFCYWHYWFGNGDKILNHPIEAVLKSGKPDFPFCLAWANHSWTNSTWTKISANKEPILIKEQKYLGKDDYELFFYDTLKFFQDKRYIKVNGKPFFMIHNPTAIPDLDVFINTWQELAKKNGFSGIYLVGSSTGISYRAESGRHQLPDINKSEYIYDSLLAKGLDAINTYNMQRATILAEGRIINFIKMFLNTRTPFHVLRRIKQEQINKNLLTNLDRREDIIPTIYPNWDRSPRVGKLDIIVTHSTPKVFQELLNRVMDMVNHKNNRIVMIRSWNEWGEGNHLEPDCKFGKGYLDVIKNTMQ